MKKTLNILTLSIMCLTISGCSSLFKGHKKCDDKSANALIQQVIKDDLDQTLDTELKDLIREGEIKDLDPAKLKVTAQNIQYSLLDSRTDFIDPNSTKTTCSVDLAVSIPSDLIKKSNEAREKVGRWSVEEQASDLGLELNNYKINLVLVYQLQPSDSGEKIFAVLKNTDSLQTLVADTLTYAFLKPQIEKNQIRLNEEVQQEEKVISEQASVNDAHLVAQEAVMAAEAATDAALDATYNQY